MAGDKSISHARRGLMSNRRPSCGLLIHSARSRDPCFVAMLTPVSSPAQIDAIRRDPVIAMPSSRRRRHGRRHANPGRGHRCPVAVAERLRQAIHWIAASRVPRPRDGIECCGTAAAAPRVQVGARSEGGGVSDRGPSRGESAHVMRASFLSLDTGAPRVAFRCPYCPKTPPSYPATSYAAR